MASPEKKVSDYQNGKAPVTYSFPSNSAELNHGSTLILFRKYQRRSALTKPEITAKASIQLPIPIRGFTDNTALKFDAVELGPVIGGLLNSGSVTADRDGAISFAGRSVISSLAGIGSEFLHAGTAEAGRSAVSDLLGVADNPNLSLIFKGVELRKHSFTWRLIAKSPEENQQLSQIIFTMKQLALPSKGASGSAFSLGYPHLVDVSFKPKNLIPMSQFGSFVTSINVDYSGDGHPSFFEDGAPTIIDLTMNIEERFIMTTEDVTSYGKPF